MANSTQIDATTYYRLPTGKFLEDFIYYKGLNFNMGSALKYRWRAGKKDGESREKDLLKCEHYIRFETQCRHMSGTSYNPNEDVRAEIELLILEANCWGGM